MNQRIIPACLLIERELMLVQGCEHPAVNDQSKMCLVSGSWSDMTTPLTPWLRSVAERKGQHTLPESSAPLPDASEKMKDDQ